MQDSRKYLYDHNGFILVMILCSSQVTTAHCLKADNPIPPKMTTIHVVVVVVVRGLVPCQYLITIFVLPRYKLFTSVEVQLEAVKLTD